MRLNTKSEHWSHMMRHALMIGILPHEFWDLSVLEWKMLTGQTAAALSHKELENLIREFDK